MTDIDRLEERLTAVERTVVDGDYELEELADVAEISDELERLDSRFDDIEERLAELEATVQSMGGFVSNVESVNDDVEQQAAAAVAAVDRLERRLDSIEQSVVAADSSDGQVATAGRDDRQRDRPSAEAESSDPERDSSDERDADDSVDRVVDELVQDEDRTPAVRGGASSDDAEPFEQSSVASDGGRSRTVRTADQRTVEKTFSPDDGADGDRASNGGETADESEGVLDRLRSKLS